MYIYIHLKNMQGGKGGKEREMKRYRKEKKAVQEIYRRQDGASIPEVQRSGREGKGREGKREPAAASLISLRSSRVPVHVTHWPVKEI